MISNTLVHVVQYLSEIYGCPAMLSETNLVGVYLQQTMGAMCDVDEVEAL
jgi:hypothetical protein